MYHIFFLLSVRYDPLKAIRLEKSAGKLPHCAVLIHVQDNDPPPCLPHLGEESLVHQLVSQITSSLTSY